MLRIVTTYKSDFLAEHSSMMFEGHYTVVSYVVLVDYSYNNITFLQAYIQIKLNIVKNNKYITDKTKLGEKVWMLRNSEETIFLFY